MTRALDKWRAVMALAMTLVSQRTLIAEPLRLVATIPLVGVEGRFDHMTLDPDGQRLFVAALGNNSLEVVDLAIRKVVRSIDGLHEPQGVVFLKDHAMVAVACGGDGSCRFFDANSFRFIDAVDFQTDADNLRYDPVEQRLYVGFGQGAIGVIDTVGRKRLADVKLSEHPESFQLESKGTRLFVNVPGAGEIAVLDRRQASVVARWPVQNAQANFPLALDEERQRLFIACRSPAEVLVYDTESGRIAARFATVGDADDLFYDERTRRLYVSGGEGFIAVHQRQNDDDYSLLAKIPSATGARTALFAPALARLYLAVPHRGSQDAEVRVYEVVP